MKRLHPPMVATVVALFAAIAAPHGALEPSTLVASSGNVFSEEELKSVQKQGAVGDICLRFYDAKGQAVRGALDDRVIGMTLDGLRRVQRSVAVCGGKRKFQAILGAVRGKWINTLVTDQYTAERLAKAHAGQSFCTQRQRRKPMINTGSFARL